MRRRPIDDGNVQLWGIPGVQKEVVLAAARSLVTVERMVDRIGAASGGVVIPGWVIDLSRWRRVDRCRHTVSGSPNATMTSTGSGIELSRDRDKLRRVDGRERAARRGGASSVNAVNAASAGEVQTIVAARRLQQRRTVFIGVGRPSTAAILARMVHNPDLMLVYESGTIGAKPFHVPLSIGDGELA